MSARNAFVDEEAENESGSEEDAQDSSDDEDMDDDQQLHEVADGFIVDEDEDEADEDDDDDDDQRAVQKRKKKRRKRSQLLDLDEDDLALVEENTVRHDAPYHTCKCILICTLCHGSGAVSASVTPCNAVPHLSTAVQGRKIKRHKRVFKRQNEVVAPVGRDGLAREFGGEDGLEDLEGVC